MKIRQSDFYRNIIALYGKKGKKWLDQLPRRVIINPIDTFKYDEN